MRKRENPNPWFRFGHSDADVVVVVHQIRELRSNGNIIISIQGFIIIIVSFTSWYNLQLSHKLSYDAFFV